MWFPVWDLSSGFRGFHWSLMVADLRLQGDAKQFGVLSLGSGFTSGDLVMW